MSGEPHVGVFYSAGRDLDAVVRQVTARFPNGRVTLLLPPQLAEARRSAGAPYCGRWTMPAWTPAWTVATSSPA